MKRILSTVFGAAAAVAVAVGVYLSFFAAQQAPQVEFVTIHGDRLSTADLRGKVVLVNFWATSCVTCVQEMPEIVDTYRKFHSQGFETVAVAMSYDPPNYVAHFASQRGLPFKVALDPTGDIAKRFGDVRLTPTTFILDKRGNVIKRYLGAPNFAELHSLLDAKLRETS